ncbi:hypothetical protein E4V99_14035 [Microbacterium sp. dk485]|uniref:hypothetical protein n=1 Tax=Microbacterium sp. dk485 TaxID=2560021 RepID=UPI001073B7C6|nr:hypothetical protein [Microbacterium sp. dk485]TFV82049.1 hypothetical protein E4V99_14035 [Microbacterium sp. dk485]
MDNNLTPNVVVANPTVRRVAQVAIGAADVALGAALVFDGATPAVDWSTWTGPTAAVLIFLSGVFGLAVVTPNIPKGSANG